MMKSSELFATQLVAFQAVRDALVSVTEVLGDEARMQQMTPDDLAIDAAITRAGAQEILEGDPEPGLLADSRLRSGVELIEEIYQDLDSWRQGLLACSMRDATQITIMMTDPGPSYRERYQRRADAIGFTLDWVRPAVSLRTLLERVDELDRRAGGDGFDPPAGRITRDGAVVETASVALTDAVDRGDLPGIQGPPQIGPHPFLEWDRDDQSS